MAVLSAVLSVERLVLSKDNWWAVGTAPLSVVRKEHCLDNSWEPKSDWLELK